MKRINLFLVVVLLLSGVAIAQNRQGRGQRNMSPEMRAERMTERMARELSLTEEQKKQVNEINLAFIKEAKVGKEDMKELRGAPAAPSKEGRREIRKVKKDEMEKVHTYMNAARESRDAKLQEVLTNEQYSKYLDMRKQMKERMDKQRD